nr:RING finger protein 224-like isoform X1 [Saimiri boliviensis boliviensis]
MEGAWALPAWKEELGELAAGQGEEECPICTEPYGPREHRLALLNCRHGLCVGCLCRLRGSAPSSDLGWVRCPLCRQKTPMLEWEICQLQEELLLADGPPHQPPQEVPAPQHRDPGWPWLPALSALSTLPGCLALDPAGAGTLCPPPGSPEPAGPRAAGAPAGLRAAGAAGAALPAPGPLWPLSRAQDSPDASGPRLAHIATGCCET